MSQEPKQQIGELLARHAIEATPRFPTVEERERAWNVLADADEFYIEPFAGCVFELINMEEPPAVSMEQIGRLACDVDMLRDQLERMLRRLARLDEARDYLAEISREGKLDCEPLLDERGSRRGRPIDAYGRTVSEWSLRP